MACEVEVMNVKNGPDLTEKAHMGEEDSDNEILALKQSLKDKLLTDNVNGSINGNHDGASTSSNSSVINNNGTVENGREENVDSEIGEIMPDTRRQTPERSAKRKLGKTKKESLIKSRKRTPIKKVVEIEEESTQSEQSFNGTESPYKDAEGDDTSTIEVLIDDEVIDVVNDDEMVVDNDVNISSEDEVVEADEADEKPKDVKGESLFYRLCNTARNSVSPRSRKLPTVSSSEGITSCSSTSFETKEANNYSFRGISGRRALHRSSFVYESCEAESSVSQNLKRKAQSESPGAPQRKYFISSLSEHSPGWKFFSSPFTRFWTPDKKSVDSAVSSSTPLRQLHEDVDLEDSLAVNVDSINISLHEDLETEKDKVESEEKLLKDEKFVAEEIPQSRESSWRCIVM